jgi:hypothetical protein
MIAAVDGITKRFAFLSDSDNTQVAVTIRHKKAFMNLDSSSTSMASLRPVLRPPISKTIDPGIGLCVSPCPDASESTLDAYTLLQLALVASTPVEIPNSAESYRVQDSCASSSCCYDYVD